MNDWTRRTFFSVLLALSLAGLGGVAWLAPGAPPSGDVGLLFALPAVVLLGTDWVTGGFLDNDFALGADVVLMVSSAGVYSVFLVMVRRMASLLTRERAAHSASLAAAVYVVVPPVAAGLGLGIASRYFGWQPQGSSAAIGALFAGAGYVLADAAFGLLARSVKPYWRWALPANLEAYGLLWVSQVSLAVMTEMTLGSLGLLSVGMFTLLAVLLRVAYGFVRRLLRLYRATAEALTVALEATLPGASRDTGTVAIVASASTRALGLPEEDGSMVESAAWLGSIMGEGFESGSSFMGEEHVALADPMKVVEASRGATENIPARFVRLGLILSETVRRVANRPTGMGQLGSDGRSESAVADAVQRASYARADASLTATPSH